MKTKRQNIIKRIRAKRPPNEPFSPPDNDAGKLRAQIRNVESDLKNLTLKDSLGIINKLNNLKARLEEIERKN